MKLADLWIKLGLKKDGFDKGITDAKSKTNVFGSAVKKIGGLMAGAFAAERVLAFGKELLELGGIAEGVRAAFARIGGEKYLEDLKSATKGTVSELELMKRSVMASNFQIPIENLADLFKFATKRAQETGESVDYLVNSIVLGIGRKSPLILDNLGISAVRLRQELKGAGVEMNTVQDIAAAVGRIAAEEMKKSGDIIETNAIKIQNLKAQWSNLKLAISENKAVIESLSDSLSKTQQLMAVWNSEYATTVEKWAISVELFDKRAEKIYNNVMSREKEMQRLRSMTSTDLQKELEKQETAYHRLAMAQNGSYLGLADEAAALERLKTKVSEIIAERQKNVKHIDYESEAYRNQIAAEQDAALEKRNHVKTIKEVKDEIKLLTEALDTYTPSQKEEIENTKNQIKALENLLNPTIAQRQEFERLNAEYWKSVEVADTLDDSIKKLSSTYEKANEFFMGASAPDVSGIVGGGGVFSMFGDEAESADLFDTAAYAAALEQEQSFINDMNSMLEAGMADFATTFASGIGEALATGEWDDFGSAVLEMIGGFMQQLGALMIAYAINMGLFTAAATNPLSWPVALAAGVAMVAAGAAISSFASKGIGGSAGASSASGYSASGSSASTVLSGNVNFVLEGDKLVGAINNNSRRRSITG